MALAERAKLIAELSLDDKMSPAIQRIDRRLGAFSGAVNRNLGRAVDTAASFAVRGLVGAFKGGIESLRALEVATAQTNAVIKSTGGVAGETAADIVALSEKYEGLNATIDNKVIQSAENVLLTFTNVRKQAFEPALQAALDLNQAMGGGEGGLQGTIVQLGKALNDPIKGLTSLQRVGVTFSADQKAQIKDLVAKNDLLGAQGIILAELSKEFGGSFAAAGNTAAGAQAKLADSIEDVQIALATDLLPVVQNVTQKLSSYLGKPSTIAFFKDLGHTISTLFTDENLDAAAGAIQTAATAVGGAISAFNKLPGPIKALAVGAFAINKVTGGAIGGIASGFGKVLGAGLSKIFATNVTVVGANVTGGAVGSATGAATSTASRVSGVLQKVAIVAEIIGLVTAVEQVREQIGAASTEQANAIQTSLNEGINVKTRAELQTALDGINKGINDLQANPLNVLVQGDALDTLKSMRDQIASQIIGAGLTGANGATRDMDKLGGTITTLTKAFNNPSWLPALKAGWQKFGEVTRAQLNLARADLAKGTNVSGAAAALGANVGAHGPGSGGVNVIKSTISQLKAALLKTYNPTEIKSISKAIHQLRDRLPAASERRSILQHAEKIATSSQSTAKKLEGLKKDLGKVESPGLRRKISDLIGEIKKEPPKADHRSRNVESKVKDTTTKVDQTRTAVNATRDAARRAGQTTTSAVSQAQSAIVQAIVAAGANVPVVNVLITASNVQAAIDVGNRAGPRNGSAKGGGGSNPRQKPE